MESNSSHPRSVLSYLPNLLTLMRLPLSVLIWHPEKMVVIFALCLAMITDFLDGFLARRFRWQTSLGKILDPITDKIFAISVVALLYSQGVLQEWQILCLFFRDLSVLAFGCYLVYTESWSGIYVKSIWSGKVTTSFQLLAFFLLFCGLHCPDSIFIVMAISGLFSFVELLIYHLFIKSPSCSLSKE